MPIKSKERALEKSEREPKEQAEFLQKGKNMKGIYLGTCLDNCRWGSPETIMYEMNIRGMVSFVRNWILQNKNNFQNLFHEKDYAEFYTEIKLPYINHKTCPANETHELTVKDCAGNIRCAHKSEEKLKPNYVTQFNHFDEMVGLTITDFYESPPIKNTPNSTELLCGIGEKEWEQEQEEYKIEMKKFKDEKPTFVVQEFCYSILSDKGRILPLETIIKRLNVRPEFITVYCDGDRLGHCERPNELSKDEKEDYTLIERCPGHKDTVDNIDFPFTGRELALYVKKWHEQLPNRQAPFYEKNVKSRRDSIRQQEAKRQLH